MPDEEILIRVKSDGTITVQEQGLVQTPPITTLLDDIIKAMNDIPLASVTCETPVLPKNCIYYARGYEKQEFVVIERDSFRRDVKYKDKLYKNVGFPKLVMGISLSEGYVYKTMLCAAKDFIIKPDSMLYKYPFSNIYQEIEHPYEVCWGNYEMHNISSTNQLTTLLDVFLSLEMTDEMYPGTGNMTYQELLESLENRDFDDNLLVPTVTFEEFQKMM